MNKSSNAFKILAMYQNDFFNLPKYSCKAEVAVSGNGYVYAPVAIWLSGLRKKLENSLGISFKPSPDLGPHISVWYEDEQNPMKKFQARINVCFEVSGLARVRIFGKEYFVLIVESDQLEHERISRGLEKNPCFRGVSVPFHITVGEIQ